MRFPNYNGEWQKTVMGKVCSFRKGYGIAKDDLSSDGTPCILYGELYTTYKTAIAKTIKSKTSIQSKSLVYSQKDDVIILAGKGQETYQIIGKEKHDFDERVVVYKHLNK